jgi:SET domain-containing protein
MHVYPISKCGDESYVEIRDSTLINAGKGVFAKKNIFKETIIGQYSGKVLLKKELDKKYGDNVAPYVLSVICRSSINCGKVYRYHKHKLFIDGESCGHWTRYINDGPHSGINANVAFLEDGKVISLTNIEKGEEIFVDYGDEYW